MNLNLGDLQNINRKSGDALSSRPNAMNNYAKKYLSPIVSAGMAIAALIVVKGCWDDICRTARKPISDFGPRNNGGDRGPRNGRRNNFRH